ncbi:MAG: hypothetical protein CMM01_04070 [Rhodopirellula sp.]|nr:hypothetical protein [Rhodopirellula sp.]
MVRETRGINLSGLLHAHHPTQGALVLACMVLASKVLACMVLASKVLASKVLASKVLASFETIDQLQWGACKS